MKSQTLIGATAYQQAQTKARYGHRDWIVYRTKDGTRTAEPSTSQSIKRALLAVGTQGHFTLILASTGAPLRKGWKAGINTMQWAKEYERTN